MQYLSKKKCSLIVFDINQWSCMKGEVSLYPGQDKHATCDPYLSMCICVVYVCMPDIRMVLKVAYFNSLSTCFYS